MWQWLKKFRYEYVATEQITKEWSCGTQVIAHVLFYKNGFGWRKVKKMGSLYPSTHEEHQFWSYIVLPWLKGKDFKFTSSLEKSPPPPKKAGDGNVVPFRRK